MHQRGTTIVVRDGGKTNVQMKVNILVDLNLIGLVSFLLKLVVSCGLIDQLL